MRARPWEPATAFTPAEDALRRAYLAWMIEQAEILPLPFDCDAADRREDPPLQLAEVYVPLRVLPVRVGPATGRLLVAEEGDSMSA